VTATCRYCRATLPRHVSMATHYATCSVLAICLVPDSPFPNHPRVSETERASRVDQQRETELARARRQVKSHN
jgi:hypothetical protein